MHVDMDAFFAALEQRENPALRGKPVVVGADPKKGRGRGVVSTASYEARKFGVHSAQPISIAYRKCPHCIFVRPNFELYSRVSHRIENTLRSWANAFESGGIDEWYMDVTKRTRKSFERAKKLALAIKHAIFEKEKLTCSIGIAPNKTVAKIASDYVKPNGLTIVTPQRLHWFLDPLPVRQIPGVGPKTEGRLHEMRIQTIGQLRKVDFAILEEEFGKWGSMIWELANGRDQSPVEESGEAKTIGREDTFDRDVTDQRLILRRLDELAERVWDDVQEARVSFREIAIKVRYAWFETHTKQRAIKETPDRALLQKTARELLEPFLQKRKPVRLIGVRVGKLLQ